MSVLDPHIIIYTKMLPYSWCSFRCPLYTQWYNTYISYPYTLTMYSFDNKVLANDSVNRKGWGGAAPTIKVTGLLVSLHWTIVLNVQSCIWIVMKKYIFWSQWECGRRAGGLVGYIEKNYIYLYFDLFCKNMDQQTQKCVKCKHLVHSAQISVLINAANNTKSYICNSFTYMWYMSTTNRWQIFSGFYQKLLAKVKK